MYTRTLMSTVWFSCLLQLHAYLIQCVINVRDIRIHQFLCFCRLVGRFPDGAVGGVPLPVLLSFRLPALIPAIGERAHSRHSRVVLCSRCGHVIVMTFVIALIVSEHA